MISVDEKQIASLDSEIYLSQVAKILYDLTRGGCSRFQELADHAWHNRKQRISINILKHWIYKIGGRIPKLW